MSIPSDAASVMSLWLEADTSASNATPAAAANGDRVAAWADTLSGSGKSATQGTNGSRPTFITNVLNGNPILRFAASGPNWLDISSFSLSQPFTVGMLFNITSGTAGTSQCIYDDTAGSSRVLQGAALNGTAFPMGMYAGGTVQEASGSYPTAAWHWTHANYNGSTSSLLQEGLPIIGLVNPGSNNLTSFRIGARFSATLGFNGDLALIYITSGLANMKATSAIARYIGPKYNLSGLPTVVSAGSPSLLPPIVSKSWSYYG